MFTCAKILNVDIYQQLTILITVGLFPITSSHDPAIGIFYSLLIVLKIPLFYIFIQSDSFLKLAKKDLHQSKMLNKEGVAVLSSELN